MEVFKKYNDIIYSYIWWKKIIPLGKITLDNDAWSESESKLEMLVERTLDIRMT